MRNPSEIEAWHAGDVHLEKGRIRPFLHAGTFEQASMRSKPAMTRLEIRPRRVRRLIDRGEDTWSHRKLSDASTRGFDMIVYLNRFEGIPLEDFEEAMRILKAKKSTKSLEEITDSDFRRLVPSARDSFIVLDPFIVRGCEPHLVERVIAEENAR